MTYATQADLEARFGPEELLKLADRDGDGAADATVVGAALTDAAAEIDGHLATAYDLPLAAGPWPSLRAAACDLARLRLYDEAAPEEIWRRALRTRDMLAKLAAGERQLVSAAGAVAARRSEARIAGSDPTFSREATQGF